MIFGKVPTAWLQLTFHRLRFLVAIIGIAFIVVLIFIHLGFRTALIESSVRIHQSLQGDIVLLSPRSSTLVTQSNFSQRRLYQTLALEEVDSVVPIYTGLVKWKNSQNKKLWRDIFVIGFDVHYPIINLPGVNQYLSQLQEDDTVLFADGSRSEYGNVVEKFKEQGMVITEVRANSPSDRKIMVVGLFKLGTSFGIDGTLITSDLNFLRIFAPYKEGFINIGLIKLKPFSNIPMTITKIQQLLDKDVVVLSREDFMDHEKKYWLQTTPIGFMFNFSLAGSSLVGIVIVYQILYSNLTDSLSEYATLKAIGYQHRYLLFIVFQEAAILAILGYIPGLLLSLILYDFSAKTTGLPIYMETNRAIYILLTTILITFISGAITIKKLKETEPVDVF